MSFPTTSLGSIVPGQQISRDVEFFDDFTTLNVWTPGATAPMGTWVRNNTGGIVVNIIAGSILNFITGASNNDKEEWIQTVSAFAPGGLAATSGAFSRKFGTDTYFATRIRIPSAIDITTVDWYAGLSGWTTTVITPSGGNAVNFIGFSSSTGSAIEDSASSKIYCMLADDATSYTAANFIDSGQVVAANKFMELAFYIIDGRRINFFVNGQQVASRLHGTTMPDAGDQLACAFGVKNNATVGVKNFQVDYIFAAQSRETNP